MPQPNLDHNRLLLEIEKITRQHNRDVINPMIAELCINDLHPLKELLARARGDYIKEFLDLAKVAGNGSPSIEQIDKLHKLRLTFEELLAAMQALEDAIERGYLDVKGD
ncbi:MAG TPA: hypothetical protein ENI79_05600 [Rhodospirillales bacterium]|nr:hypothetical protein [Rhodospirillales bacterium]